MLNPTGYFHSVNRLVEHLFKLFTKVLQCAEEKEGNVLSRSVTPQKGGNLKDKRGGH